MIRSNCFERIKFYDDILTSIDIKIDLIKKKQKRNKIICSLGGGGVSLNL